MVHAHMASRREYTAARALSVHRFLFRCALSVANVFAWVLFFDYLLYFTRGSVPDAFILSLLCYGAMQTVTFLSLPLVVRSVRSGVTRLVGLATLLMN